MEYINTQALSFDDMDSAPRLYMRSPEGKYKVANCTEILAAGRKAADRLVSRLDQMGKPEMVKEFFQAKLMGLDHEAAGFLYLDSQLQPIRYLEQVHGTLSSASVYPREVVKAALRLNAAACVMAHNHPSGICEPSAADINLTRQLKQALALVDVRLLDHIVVSAGGCASLAERGQC